MHVKLNATVAEEYANIVGRTIDYDEEEPKYFAKGGMSKTISAVEADAILVILTCEVSIYTLRRITGACGSNVDTMAQIRKTFINNYENQFARKYVDVNEGEYW